jgi:hypothetical protein
MQTVKDLEDFLGKPLLFAASCMSKWHAVGVQAWVKGLERQLGAGCGIIFLRTHARSGAALSQDDFLLFKGRENILIVDDSHFPRNPGHAVAALNIAFRKIVGRTLPSKHSERPANRFYFASPQRVDWAVRGAGQYLNRWLLPPILRVESCQERGDARLGT